MRKLKALGVRLAIDDFGTGYASLSYLRSFSFDVIKIDRQFISDLESIAGGRAIVQAILVLGDALRLSVTAECVETERQLDMLVERRPSENARLSAGPTHGKGTAEQAVPISSN